MSRLERLRLHPDAAEELAAALQWYTDRSPVAAAAFLLEIEHAAERIVEAPLRWPRFTRKCRRYLLPTFPFSVVYSVRDRFIEVLAVAHHRRRPGYWKPRGN